MERDGVCKIQSKHVVMFACNDSWQITFVTKFGFSIHQAILNRIMYFLLNFWRFFGITNGFNIKNLLCHQILFVDNHVDSNCYTEAVQAQLRLISSTTIWIYHVRSHVYFYDCMSKVFLQLSICSHLSSWASFQFLEHFVIVLS